MRTVAGRNEKTTTALCAEAHGFSLHGGVRCGAHQRKELERLCRTITRPAIAFDRVSVEQVEQTAAAGKFFPDCPDSTLALTQMLDCFESAPSAFSVALERLVNRRSDAPVEDACRKAIELAPTSARPWDSLGDLLCDDLKRYDEAESAYRKAIELDPKWATPWGGLGVLLHVHLKRYDEAESAYRKAIELDPKWAWPWDALGDLLRVDLKRYDEAERASKNEGSAFYQLKEQCFECHAIGLSKALIELMERSRYANFLQPFALALRAASGDKAALLDVAVEVRGMAEEVLVLINGERK